MREVIRFTFAVDFKIFVASCLLVRYLKTACNINALLRGLRLLSKRQWRPVAVGHVDLSRLSHVDARSRPLCCLPHPSSFNHSSEVDEC